MISDQLINRNIYIYYWYFVIVSSRKKGGVQWFFLSFNFESIDRYYQGTDVLNQWSSFFKNIIKKKWNGVFSNIGKS